MGYKELNSTEVVSLTLSQILQARTRKNPSYSLRSFARDLKLSPGFVSLLLKGKKRLSLETGREVMENLNIPLRQQKRFLKAIAESSTSNSEASNLLKEPGYFQQYQNFELDQFQYFNQWYHVAISDLTTCADFEYNISWIAKKLNLGKDVVKTSVDRLLRLGVLKEINETLVKTNLYIAIPTNSAQNIIQNFHKQMIQKALDHLSQTDEKEFKRRNISGITFAISPSKVETAKQKIANFKREMAELSEEEDCTEVYQLNIQFFPLTQASSEDS